MEARREQVFVGLFVIVAAALLLFTVFTLTGVFASATRTYHARFHNVAGLEPGATVRYEGGNKVGRVEKIKIDPNDPSWMEMEFSVKSEIPVKSDSHVAIMSFTPLSDNHLEIKAGSASAPRAPDGALLPSDPYIGFNDLTGQFNKMAPQAQDLLANLNDRVAQLKITIDRVNDLLNDKNRENMSASISELRGMLAENRGQIQAALKNVSAASEKISPLLDEIQKTVDQANGTLTRVDGMLDENRADVRAAVANLRESVEHVTALTGLLQQMLENNDFNIEQVLNNMRIVTDNLKQFTDTIKTRPSALINSGAPRDHKPGEMP